MIIIKQADVYSPEYLGKRDIMICGGKIEHIDTNIKANFKNCKIIDGTDKILTPGFIDQHIHVTGGGGEGGFCTRAPEVNITELIRGGITTVVGLLGTDGVTRNVENLIAKVKALKEDGITAFACTGSYGYPSITITGNISKDIVFIDEILGLKLAISDHRAPNVTNEELIRAASDVRTAAMISGKPGILVLHVGDGETALKQVFEALEITSIPIKTFRPTHVNRNSKLLEQAFLFAKKGGFIDLTCGSSKQNAISQCIKKAKLNNVPLNNITLSSDGQGSWSKYDENGGLTDMGISGVNSIYEQFVHFVQSDGMPIDEALRYTSANTADALELYPRKGSISTGSDADILLFDKELALETVIANGVIMMENYVNIVKGIYEK